MWDVMLLENEPELLLTGLSPAFRTSLPASAHLRSLVQPRPIHGFVSSRARPYDTSSRGTRVPYERWQSCFRMIPHALSSHRPLTTGALACVDFTLSDFS